MLLSSVKKTQILCFWQLWNPGRLWLAGWWGRIEFGPTRAWMELHCVPSLHLPSFCPAKCIQDLSYSSLLLTDSASPGLCLDGSWHRGWGPSCVVGGSCQACTASLDVQVFRNKPQPTRWSMKRLGASFWQRSSLGTQLVWISKLLQALASFVSLCAGVLHL